MNVQGRAKNGAGAGGNFRGNFWGNFRGNLRGVRRRTAACLAAVVAMLLAGCSSNVYLQARKRTSVSEGIPDARQLDTLCRHRMTVGAGECYDLLLGVLLGVLLSEGCLIESADRASGLVVARQVLPAEGMTVVPMAGEIRHLSFLVQPAHLTSEVRLTVYVSRQWYSDEGSGFTTEELGLSTDPEIYRSWFERLDRAVPR